MESRRILLSDKYGHRLSLTEQEIGVAIHALVVLRAAFDCEPLYGGLAEALREKLAQALERKALTLEEL